MMLHLEIYRLYLKPLNCCRIVKNLSSPTFPGARSVDFALFLVHNHLGNIGPVTVTSVIEKHVQPLQAGIKEMLKE